MNWLNEIWEFPMTLLAWIVFHLALIFKNAKWIDHLTDWVGLDTEKILEILDKE